MKKIISAILFLGMLVSSSACARSTATATLLVPTHPISILTTTPEAPAAPTATFPMIVTATPGPTTPTPIATPLETTAPLPSEAAPGGGTAERLSLASGVTAAGVNGNLAAQGQRSYLLHAAKDQYLMVALETLDPDVWLAITGSDGKPLLAAASRARAWQGALPATQDYRIDVVSSASAPAAYALQVTLPQRIRFAPGGISATLNGSVPANGVTTYLAGASAGQSMTVSIAATGPAVHLSVYGLTDGQSLVNPGSDVTTWTGKLPLTQDYVISAVSSGEAALYTLTLTIP